jgi:hypothetical protein
MKRYKLILPLLLLSCALNLLAQENPIYEENFPAYIDYFSKEFGIDCKIPEGFTSMEKYFVMWKVRENNNKHTGNMYGPLFLSKDENCLIMFPSIPNDVSKDNIKFKNENSMPLNPWSQINAEINTALGLYYYHGSPLNSNTTKLDFNDYVTVLSGKKVREMFNADTLYFYDIPGADSVFFIDESIEKLRKRKYPNCTGFVIYKLDIAILDFKFLFTEKGEKNKEKYFNMLNKHIWFDENFKHK